MKKERLIPLFPIDYCRFLKSLLSHSKYFVKEETTLCGYKVSKKSNPQNWNVLQSIKALCGADEKNPGRRGGGPGFGYV